METSKTFQTTENGSFSKISPNGKYFAYVFYKKIRVHLIKDVQLIHEFTCPEIIEEFSWSPDSDFLMCCIFSHSLLQIFSLEHPDWRCKIDQGSDGLVSALWSPDGRHVLTTVKFHLWTCVWSLSDRSVDIIENIKIAEPSMEFSPNGLYLAVVERLKSCESIAILCANSWNLITRLLVALTDVAGFVWSPDSSCICAWENPGYKIINITNLQGEHIAEFTLDSLINTAVWGGNFLSIGCTDNSVYVINCLTWNILTKFQHVSVLPTLPRLKVYEEVAIKKDTKNTAHTLQQKSKTLEAPISQSKSRGKPTKLKYQLATTRPLKIPLRENVSGTLKKGGVSEMLFNPDMGYLACRCYNFPTVVWIWNLRNLTLKSVLIQKSTIRCMRWQCGENRLVICTAKQPSPHFFVWSSREATATYVPHLDSESLVYAQWHPHRSRELLLLSSSKKTFIVKQREPVNKWSL